ncbi:AI-2E family transporter [Sporosarcina sp. 179-K 3D1 HS]|uniref:AI-2E family transporter n=1 Tax=Sporosarcina sp. 179-K 3D1 HS TaxID=3232169 RepID=UPI0039A16851
MPLKHEKQRVFQKNLVNWLPVALTGIILFTVPPAAIAVILAYFTAPMVMGVRSFTKLPLTISTLFIMTSMLGLIAGFMYMAIHGLLETIPTIERHIAPYTQNTDITGKLFYFLETKVVEYGHAILEYVLTTTRTLFQHLLSIFIFLVAYFFALRESGKDRFWFLTYFPARARKKAKDLFEEGGKLIGTFVFVEARLFFITFITITIGFFFLHFESPVGNAFLISLVDSLPFLGIGIFLLPMSAFFLYSGELYIGIALILLYLFTMTTRQMAESYMWASTFNVKPVHAFFITISAFYLFGLPGILLTPFFLFAAIKVKSHPLFTAS